jgi:hypothetical protein
MTVNPTELFQAKKQAEKNQFWLRLSTPPRTIYRLDDPTRPYLIRWTLAALGPLRLHLHCFLSSDPGHLHDHPWWFISLILAGNYFEQTPSGTKPRRAGSIAFHPPLHRHRVLITGPCVSLILTGPRVREWGFYTRLCGWVPWFQYQERQHDC